MLQFYKFNLNIMTNTTLIESMAQQCLHIIQMYSWLLDSFVLDFYTEEHWKRMPKSWQNFLLSVMPEELGDWLSSHKQIESKKVWPLSLLALRSVVRLNMLPRQPSSSGNANISLNSAYEWLDGNLEKLEPEVSSASDHLDDEVKKVKSNNPQSSTKSHAMDSSLMATDINKSGILTCCVTNPGLRHLFIKHVKPKKRHEILAMAKVCSKAAQRVNCTYVVDVGSGKGHLSRLLAYGYGLKVCCLDAQAELTETARKLDEELEYTARKHIDIQTLGALSKPVHINMTLNSGKNPSDFVKEIREAFHIPPESPFAFGFVGLHPCGDLAPTLLHLFSKCSEARFISIVGCCYMKLTLKSSEQNETPSYPLSSYFLSQTPQMLSQSYEALEIACHAIEEYSKRLQSKEYASLKIHNYRAVLERIIVDSYPDKRRLGLRSVKHAHKMNFAEYAKIAVSRAGLEISEQAFEKPEIQDSLESWRLVVIFYTLRLLVAPLVETALLLDRLLFLGEQGHESCLLPGFDPVLSPRNHILLGCKR